MLSGPGRKRKGARRELQALHSLEKQGYLVTKAGGSLGAFDLIAIGMAHDRLIQVKSNRMPGKEEKMNLLKLTKIYHQDWRSIELWVYKDGEKFPYIYPLDPTDTEIKTKDYCRLI